MKNISSLIYVDLFCSVFNKIILDATTPIFNHRTNGHVKAHLISVPIWFLKVFTINKHSGHLVHVACTIYINFLSHFPRRLNMKFGID